MPSSASPPTGRKTDERGISIDSAYLASLLGQIPGPVLAVGHSYGGAVISNAATRAKNVVALVFVAAFAPDEGERLGEVSKRLKGERPEQRLVPLRYPAGNGAETAVEFAIDPQKLHDAFAADLPVEQALIAARHAAPGVGAGLLRAERASRLEELAFVGRGCHRRQGRRD